MGDFPWEAFEKIIMYFFDIDARIIFLKLFRYKMTQRCSNSGMITNFSHDSKILTLIISVRRSNNFFFKVKIVIERLIDNYSYISAT